MRPNLEGLKIPPLLKDLIKKCWDDNPEKRVTATELYKIIWDWQNEIENKKNTKFYHQYQALESEYNAFSLNIHYQIGSTSPPLVLQVLKKSLAYSKNPKDKLLKQKLKKWKKKLTHLFLNLNYY